jgi:hypothetical protein
MGKGRKVPCDGCTNCLGKMSGSGVNATIPCLNGDRIEHIYVTHAHSCQNFTGQTAYNQVSQETLAMPPSEC